MNRSPPASPATNGEVAQAKWAAWRHKKQLESVCEAKLDEQINLVIKVLDSVIALGPE